MNAQTNDYCGQERSEDAAGEVIRDAFGFMSPPAPRSTEPSASGATS